MFGKKGETAVLEKLAKAPEPYREIGERLHALIRENAPTLEPILRWGIPFYTRNGEDICYIKSDKDYLVFGFGETVNPAFTDGEALHPIVWSITSLDEQSEARIIELIKKAVS
ncbi:MAG: DUF1801 domain-containing protein [Gulosibacter sp.]|uniref:DUF1801 domain-containing protein n=1 Tax=Gulosibacter sp. TaxID=2817531 RepID=UPI003F9387E0